MESSGPYCALKCCRHLCRVCFKVRDDGVEQVRLEFVATPRISQDCAAARQVLLLSAEQTCSAG